MAAEIPDFRKMVADGVPINGVLYKVSAIAVVLSWTAGFHHFYRKVFSPPPSNLLKNERGKGGKKKDETAFLIVRSIHHLVASVAAAVGNCRRASVSKKYPMVNPACNYNCIKQSILPSPLLLPFLSIIN